MDNIINDSLLKSLEILKCKFTLNGGIFQEKVNNEYSVEVDDKFCKYELTFKVTNK